MECPGVKPKLERAASARPPWGVWAYVRRLAGDLLRAASAAVFLAYCGWWVLWLARGRLPPALFLALTGLPAPTTGCTRSVLWLMQGNWRESLCWHPLSVPILGLFILSLGWLGWEGLRGRRPRLPTGFLYVWVVLLLAAWGTKLLTSPAYW